MNLKSILVLAFFIIYVILCWKYYVCNIKNLCPESETPEVAQSRYPIQFYKNSDSYVLGDFDQYADSLIGASKSNNIDLVGYYTPEEVNSSSFENLGIARAQLLKELLINRGLDSNRVQVFGLVQNIIFQDSLALAHSTDISANLDLSVKDVQLVSHHGMTEIYFPSNSEEEITNDALTKFLSSLVSSAKDSKVSLIGHTDNVGSEEANKALSLKRTYSVRNQLIKLGMPTTNILCEGRGSSSPKVNNSTAENRALNRRVEVKVQ
jgi:OOP family OmpA-OmpF porin